MRGELPRGWASAPLSDLGSWLGGGTPSKAVPEFWTGGTIPWVSPKDMKRLVIDSAQDQITEAAVTGSATNLVPARSVLMVTRSGILEHTFPVAVNAVPVTINQDLKAWTPRGVDSLYAAYYLRSRQQDVLRDCSKDGTTVSSIEFDQLAKFPMLVAPLAEQQRIVSRIEELFSEIDVGERALERVGRLVERYRQSVLKAAFVVDDAHSAGWRWAPLSDLVDEGPTNGYSPKAEPGASGSLSLKLTATTSGRLRLDADAVKQLNEVIDPASPLWLRPGDLLIQRANSLEHVGVSVIFEGPPSKYIYPDLMMRVRIADPLLRQWVCRFLNSTPAKRYFQQEATGTAGSMPKISGKVVKALRVPVPPAREMKAALSLLDRSLEIATAVSGEIARRLAHATALRQSILKAAFSGQLVPQDPRDEPASALLARLAAQSADAPVPKRRGRPPRQAAATA